MTPRSKGHRLADLSSAQVLEQLRGRNVVWPIGATEQHGPHLPLSVDTVIAEEFARQIAYELDGFTAPSQSLAARSLPQSGGGLAFPGTLHVSGETLICFLKEAARSLMRLPFERLIVVNGHFENEPFIFEAFDSLCQEGTAAGKEIIAFSWWSLVEDSWLRDEVAEFPGWHAEHAGLTETSMMLYLRPDLVADARPDHDRPPRAGIYLHPVDADSATNSGVLSSTSGSSAELGEKLFWHVVAQSISLIREGEGLLRKNDVSIPRGDDVRQEA
ncbi:creatininase family protein [Streptomyces malaysiensis]|uniref:Creatininase family protein n=1 Tax=Streptomyces malaysiensis subsp. samsunensis TaxID=459658 RepID=A0A9X2M7C9_STRMQ|nr:creatininase family protein [Streptomyces samsunensis]MCQ8836408.1 creatininase family protein [Streptomyces samsunensis]